MATRYYRHTESGEWYEGSKRREGAFSGDGRLDADAIAAAQDWAPGTVEIVDVADGEPDPRRGGSFSDPPADPEPPSPDDVLVEELRSSTTLAALRAALLRRFAG